MIFPIFLNWENKKYTSVLKKILKIFLNVTDISVTVSAKNLDFIPYIELVMAN